MDPDFIEGANLVLEAISDTIDENLLYCGFKLQEAEDWVLGNFGLKEPMGDLSMFYKGI